MFLYPYPHPVHFTEVTTTNWNQNERISFAATATTSTSINNPPSTQPQQQSTASTTTTVEDNLRSNNPNKLLELGQIDYTIDEKPIIDFDTFGIKEPCPNCNELIPTMDLIQHIRNHMGPRRCEICSYEAPTKHHLREHMNTHTGLKPYKCIYCDKCFAAKNSLRVHTMYLHTKIRSHQCRFCEQRFVTTSERKSHELVHTDKCPICSMSFRLRGHLRQHMKIHSSGGGGQQQNGGGGRGGGGRMGVKKNVI